MVGVLLVTFVLVRSGGVQGFLDKQRSLTQITVTPFLLGGSEGIAFLILCAAALVMGKVEHRKLGEYGLPWREALGRDFWKGSLWGFLAISGALLAMFLLHGFRITGLALHGRQRFCLRPSSGASHSFWLDCLRNFFVADTFNTRWLRESASGRPRW
jgi:hypothetical protein